MDMKHYNELIELSQGMYDAATDKLTNYCAAKYCGVDSESMQHQMEDYLFAAEETSAYLLGNALALLDADSQEQEIKSFTDNLRRVIRYAQQQAGGEVPPS